MDSNAVQSSAPKSTNGEVLVRVTDMKKHFPIMKGLFKRQVGAVKDE